MKTGAPDTKYITSSTLQDTYILQAYQRTHTEGIPKETRERTVLVLKVSLYLLFLALSPR